MPKWRLGTDPCRHLGGHPAPKKDKRIPEGRTDPGLMSRHYGRTSTYRDQKLREFRKPTTEQRPIIETFEINGECYFRFNLLEGG